jgi:hypothetical protein
MKKYTLNQEFSIVKQWTTASTSPKTYGIPTIYIIFKGVLDGQEYRTYIVEGFKNVARWEEIISTPNYKKLRIRFPNGRLSGNVIDADSTPEIVADAKQNTLADIFN